MNSKNRPRAGSGETDDGRLRRLRSQVAERTGPAAVAAWFGDNVFRRREARQAGRELLRLGDLAKQAFGGLVTSEGLYPVDEEKPQEGIRRAGAQPIVEVLGDTRLFDWLDYNFYSQDYAPEDHPDHDIWERYQKRHVEQELWPVRRFRDSNAACWLAIPTGGTYTIELEVANSWEDDAGEVRHVSVVRRYRDHEATARFTPVSDPRNASTILVPYGIDGELESGKRASIDEFLRVAAQDLRGVDLNKPEPDVAQR